ncbi:MAG: peptidoglycan-binding domain-containing protein [Terriglobales bacterium]|jgi:hypothetical protein
MAILSIAAAQTETSTEPKKSTHTSATSKAKTKQSATTHATEHTTTKRHSSHASTQATKTTGSGAKARSKKKSSKSSKSAKKKGQQVIDSDRARAIQEALIREHYMGGEPSGTWDAATQAAMQRYQADQGWQSKTTPDSRALIKLGLGPSHDHLLNPESAMTSTAGRPRAAPKDPPAENVPQQQ